MPRAIKNTTEDKKTTETSIKKTVKKEKIGVILETSEKKKTAKKSSTTADVVDTKGKTVETIALPEAMFNAKINNQLMAQAVRVYLANQREGAAVTKTRGEVTGSTRKIYRQKGTGRARHGGIRAPIFVHGGVAHGPRPKDYSLKLSKKMKKQAFFSALSAKLKDGTITIVKGLETLNPKTKEMALALKHIGIDDKKRKVLLVVPFVESGKETKNVDWHVVDRIARNIKGVDVVLANQLNTYAVLNTHQLLLVKDAIFSLEKHFEGKEV